MYRYVSILSLSLLTAFVVSCPSTGWADPSPVTSEYLHTFTGGFIYRHPTRDWAMFLIVQPLKKPPGGGPLYLEAEIENPQRGHAPFVIKKSSLDADRLGVKLEVSPVAGMRNGKGYQTVVRVYGDPGRTKLLGSHKQIMLYHDIGDPEQNLRRLNESHPRT